VAYDDVIRGVTLDPRISPRFLVPGVGFGGSCFPKDVKALAAAGRAKGYKPTVLEAVLAQNETQYMQAIALLEEELGDLSGKRIALLGLAFKGGTDDVRESRAIPLAKTLLAKGANVVGYDPVANDNFARVVPDIDLAGSPQEALRNADACLLQADWPEFSELTAEDFLAVMRNPVIVDGRRIVDPMKVRGIPFRRIG
jgi:UDPglucose 6-dehydrogenase